MRCIFQNGSSSSNLKYRTYDLRSNATSSKVLNSDKYFYFGLAVYKGDTKVNVKIYKIHKRVMTLIHTMFYQVEQPSWSDPTYNPQTDTITTGSGYGSFPAYLYLIECG